MRFLESLMDGLMDGVMTIGAIVVWAAVIIGVGAAFF